ncbi:hypothetical protein COU77_03115 [Candidatus Peregrinibacteria bacterium CG10_big_fil_rev_8_21_14_0_10_49_16]|nr:MAG: hypothetical protein COW95_02630 [Candidatus Peregrinibacteria bacterium CG22_combo_CG10-13_8_21_14_all_49_11]PIR52024.1 MAG: hypothetical protein COU77_03115 [Candidatus Peregrinibacteria bacterium CG10_big_fil_rev_8_21_14_0_10_49_16]
MWSFLTNHGILGLNARNLLYIKPFNPKKAIALADDKLKTKAFLATRGIPVAKIYGRIETRKQLKTFDFSSLPDECVLKPKYGFGGEGIIILRGRKNGCFLRQGKEPISHKQLCEHIEDILDGKFSVNGHADTAFFEKLLIPHESLAHLRPAGLPDIRVIVFNLAPVMAMLRIPTKVSGGKANLHLGGIGLGIDIAKGITTHGAQRHHIIHTLPHGVPVQGIHIPFWDDILLMCSRIQYLTNIGYLAVDITIDQDQGPLLLEVNARAGLGVQIANLAPLRSRLERVEGISISSPEKGVRIAQELFGEKAKKTEQAQNHILALHETISIAGDGTTIRVPCLITPKYIQSIFDPTLIQHLLEQGAVAVHNEEEHLFRVKFTLGGKKIQTIVQSKPVQEQGIQAAIGQRDLKGFLIDPAKAAAFSPVGTVREDLRAADKLLARINKDLSLLRYLKPINLEEQRVLLANSAQHNPIFRYKPAPPELDEYEEQLQSIALDASPLGIVLDKKKEELLKRISLLRVRGQGAETFTQSSLALYGSLDTELLQQAHDHLATQIACDLVKEEDVLSAKKASPIFEQALQTYGLHEWQVTISSTIIPDCMVSSKHVYLRNDALFSTERIQALIAHEIETHALTAENGEQQPYDIFRRGFANYLDTQEGLAVLNQNRILSEYSEKRFGPAKTLLGLEHALSHSFADVRAFFLHQGYSDERAVTKAIQMKRGLTHTAEPGAFTKGIVYFRGWKNIEKFVKDNGDLKKLYIGKIAIEDLPFIEQIPNIKPPLLLPTYLRET